MIEYTRKDIIMDPNDPRLEGAIGKKVHCSSDICMLLKYANEHKYEMILTRIMEEANVKPFVVTDMDGDEFDADFIIIKKEEEPEYIPFESVEEFLDEYFLNKEKYTTGILLKLEGVWLREKETGALCMATEIWDEGLVIGDTKLTIIGTDVFNDMMEWDELFSKYSFLDGSPCGKEVK